MSILGDIDINMYNLLAGIRVTLFQSLLKPDYSIRECKKVEDAVMNALIDKKFETVPSAADVKRVIRAKLGDRAKHIKVRRTKAQYTHSVKLTAFFAIYDGKVHEDYKSGYVDFIYDLISYPGQIF